MVISIVLYLLIVMSSATQSATGKLYGGKSDDSAVFNMLKADSAFVVFAVMAIFGFEFHLPTLLFGTAYGLLMCVSMYAGYQAITRGPLALSSMLVSFSVVIPVLWGVLFANESITLFRGMALALLCVAIVAVNADKFKKKEKGATDYRVWLLFVGATFLVNGVCSVIQKVHQTYYPGQFGNEFMFFAMAVCAVAFTVSVIVKKREKPFKEIEGKGYGVISGVTNGINGFLTLILAGLESASVLFPAISAGTVLAAMLSGRILFKEKLKANHFVALVAGIAAVVLLKI